MFAGILLFWALVFAVLAIHAEYRGPRILAWLFRILTISLCISLVVEAGKGGWGLTRVAVGAGLVFSLAGDVFMMLKRKRFLEGLLCFLAAQACYALAFLSGTRFRIPAWPAAVLAGAAAALAGVLYSGLGRMKIPVFVYMLVILVMAAAAVSRYDQTRTVSALAAAAGAGLFLISDGALAVNRFFKPFRAAQAVILSFYFAAQGLIALSVCL